MGETGNWEDVEGLYVYSDRDSIQYLPRRHKPFIEVVMRMLDQSDELSDETLENVHSALRTRLRVDNE